MVSAASKVQHPLVFGTVTPVASYLAQGSLEALVFIVCRGLPILGPTAA